MIDDDDPDELEFPARGCAWLFGLVLLAVMLGWLCACAALPAALTAHPWSIVWGYVLSLFLSVEDALRLVFGV